MPPIFIMNIYFLVTMLFLSFSICFPARASWEHRSLDTVCNLTSEFTDLAIKLGHKPIQRYITGDGTAYITVWKSNNFDQNGDNWIISISYLNGKTCLIGKGFEQFDFSLKALRGIST